MVVIAVTNAVSAATIIFTVQSVTNFEDFDLIARLSENLGEAMVGINANEIELLMAERGI